MTDRLKLTALLLRSVSHGALGYVQAPRFSAYHLEARYGSALRPCNAPALEPSSAFSFLARVKAWLYLLVGLRVDAPLPPAPKSSCAPLNRRFARRRQSKIIAARTLDGLVWHIYRRYGLACTQQWIYNRKLHGRVRWCFWGGVKRWMRLSSLAAQGAASLIASPCHAPLSPD